MPIGLEVDFGFGTWDLSNFITFNSRQIRVTLFEKCIFFTSYKYSQVPEVTSAAETNGDSRPRLGIGMDASVTPIPDMPGTSLAQTTDFFYPLVDDPYLQVVTMSHDVTL